MNIHSSFLEISFADILEIEEVGPGAAAVVLFA